MNNSLIKLADITPDDAKIVGGKAYNLSIMIKAGSNVPNGFVVTSPQASSEEIMTFFEELHTQYVAVRSSALCEDSKSASWAGQLSTYLYTTKETLLENIKKCQNSINSDRAIAYQSHLHQKEVPGSIPVIIQKMIPSEVSGITFTADPVNNDKTNMIIEAIYGLGEGIVSGACTPDSYSFNKATNSLQNIHIATQKTMYVQSENGTAVIAVPISKQSLIKLPEDKIVKVAKMSIEIERLFGTPQDIEWAVYNDTLYILQARPVTTLCE